ncbi:MAG TPA: hypothetical protein VH853_20855 [Polyangia bacterium]|jgi:hypothetical protein|nr:hypothetical protein [Polyangia bacterium]
MFARAAQSRRSVSVVLGLVTLASVALLLTWDFVPARFPAGSHDTLSALPLALIALAALVHRLEQRPTRAELARTMLLAAAFLFWSANQFWPESPRATLFNDLAVALFVIDVWLAIAARPS